MLLHNIIDLLMESDHSVVSCHLLPITVSKSHTKIIELRLTVLRCFSLNARTRARASNATAIRHVAGARSCRAWTLRSHLRRRILRRTSSRLPSCSGAFSWRKIHRRIDRIGWSSPTSSLALFPWLLHEVLVAILALSDQVGVNSCKWVSASSRGRRLLHYCQASIPSGLI